MIVLAVLYFLCGFALFFSYVLYPLIVSLIARGKKFGHPVYAQGSDLPDVIIFFAVYNGDRVLKEKIESMLASNYPRQKLRIIVGSDESTDNTDAIVTAAANADSRVELQRYSRRGKANVINSIRQFIMHRGINDNTVFILTDAYAIFEKETVYEMVKHFKSSEVGIVGANYINTNLKEGGISYQEKAYIQRENLMKYHESLAFGAMMGVYGACYAIRGRDFPAFPPTILMEDFYATMLMLQQHKKAILTLQSRFYENIPNSIEIEYRRKKRIAAGNFQNLGYFKALLLPKYGATAFAFFSHKVLRWLGPFFILLSTLLCFVLAFAGYKVFIGLAALHALVLLAPLLDAAFRALGVTISPLRYVTYFLGMNLAVLDGLWWYLKGIKTNVWQPTARS